MSNIQLNTLFSLLLIVLFIACKVEFPCKVQAGPQHVRPTAQQHDVPSQDEDSRGASVSRGWAK